MQLELEDGQAIDDPKEADIAKALESLDGKANSYAVLTCDDEGYLQCTGDVRGGFSLEYSDAKTEERFESKGESVPLAQVQEAFALYARGKDAWRGKFRWEKVREKSGCLGVLLLALLPPAWAVWRAAGG